MNILTNLSYNLTKIDLGIFDLQIHFEGHVIFVSWAWPLLVKHETESKWCLTSNF